MELPALVTLIALLEYMFFTFRVGLGRNKYGAGCPKCAQTPCAC